MLMPIARIKKSHIIVVKNYCKPQSQFQFLPMLIGIYLASSLPNCDKPFKKGNKRVSIFLDRLSGHGSIPVRSKSLYVGLSDGHECAE